MMKTLFKETICVAVFMSFICQVQKIIRICSCIIYTIKIQSPKHISQMLGCVAHGVVAAALSVVGEVHGPLGHHRLIRGHMGGDLGVGQAWEVV